MIPVAIKIPYVKAPGIRLPKRQWLAQISMDGGKIVETLSGEHETESLAIEAAEREIRRRETS